MHPKYPQSNFHCSVIELVCTASLISCSKLYPSLLSPCPSPCPNHWQADNFISLLNQVSFLQARYSQQLNILGIIALPIICNTNDTFPTFYVASVLCFISLHLVFSLIFSSCLKLYRSTACNIHMKNVIYFKRRKMIMVILKRPDVGLQKKLYYKT